MGFYLLRPIIMTCIIRCHPVHVPFLYLMKCDLTFKVFRTRVLLLDYNILYGFYILYLYFPLIFSRLLDNLLLVLSIHLRFPFIYWFLMNFALFLWVVLPYFILYCFIFIITACYFLYLPFRYLVNFLLGCYCDRRMNFLWLQFFFQIGYYLFSYVDYHHHHIKNELDQFNGPSNEYCKQWHNPQVHLYIWL